MRRCMVVYIAAAVPLAAVVAGAGDIETDGKVISTLASGAPLGVASSDMVENLNADMVDGVHGTEVYTKTEVDALVASAVEAVRPIVAYTGGNMSYYPSESPHVAKSVTITVPSAGLIEVDSEGYVKFYGSGRDQLRACITTSTVDIDFNYLQMVSDLGSANTEDGDYLPISGTRVYAVNEGTYTFNLLVESVYASSGIRVDDVNMTAVFYPNPPGMIQGVMPSIESQEMSAEESEQRAAMGLTGE